MSKEASRAGAVHSEQGIGNRPRRRDESTYGLPNHEDGIQSGNLTQGDSAQQAIPDDGNVALSGPGHTQSNGMKGQK